MASPLSKLLKLTNSVFRPRGSLDHVATNRAKESQASIDSVLTEELQRIVADEGFYWGHDHSEAYYKPAEKWMDAQWTNEIKPVLDRHPIDYTKTVDIGCGHGRNIPKLLSLAKNVIAVDVNPENIEFCNERFRDEHRVTCVVNSGFDLSVLETESASFIYSFDSFPCFDLILVWSYIKDIERVLQPGGYGFIHHSNYTDAPGVPFRKNPHWRNFMSNKLFAHFCIRQGFMVHEQLVYDSPKLRSSDCFTVFSKPSC